MSVASLAGYLVNGGQSTYKDYSLDEVTGSQAHLASFRLTKLMSLNKLIE
jgi:hypothetical protein